jgi:cytochrome c553
LGIGVGGSDRAAGGNRGTLWGAAVLAGLLASAPVAADDMDKAKAIVASVCSACHGMDGNSIVPTIPKLAGRHPEYLVSELKQFQAGTRKSDTMTPIVAKLSASDLKALGEYFGAQKPTSDKVVNPALAEVGKKLYLEGDEKKGIPFCSGCHGIDGSGGKRFPRLAGQHREYMIAEMNAFRSGQRDYPAARVMREVAKLMSDDDIKAVAEYLQGL